MDPRRRALQKLWLEGPQNQDKCRPEVKKYSSCIESIIRDNRGALDSCFPIIYRERILENRARISITERKVMTRTDCKLGGDTIQAESVDDNESFVSQDKMACTRATMFGKQVIHTYHIGEEFYIKLFKTGGDLPDEYR